MLLQQKTLLLERFMQANYGRALLQKALAKIAHPEGPSRFLKFFRISRFFLSPRKKNPRNALAIKPQMPNQDTFWSYSWTWFSISGAHSNLEPGT